MFLADVYSEAIEECNNTTLLVSMTNEFFNSHIESNGILYTISIHNSVINSAFLTLFMTLEKFLERSFICYMLGQTGINGGTFAKYISPPTEEKAIDLLKGTNRFADFTNRDVIVKLANNFFEGGGVYVYLNSVSVAFEEMKKIRNAISHFSTESERAFLGLARSKLGSLPANISTASFLNAVMPNTSSTFFIYYRDIIINVINNISNPT